MPSTKTKPDSKPAKKRHGSKARPGKRARRRQAEQKKKAPRFTARTADKYELYEYSVCSPDVDVEFLMRTYKKERKKTPHHFREDFCGTAAMCAEWVKQGSEFTAEGYDLDPEPVEWGKKRHVEPLGAAAERIAFHLDDVRAKGDRPADVRVAQNFSYQIFMTRAELLEYFRCAHDDLAADGLFVIDLYGGPEAIEELEEEREIEEGFTYVWDQAKYYPGTGECTCHIHFRFEDGSEMKKAFTYVWRTWHLTELRDLLHEAGFVKVESYFEGTDDETEEGDGQFEKDPKGEACLSWVAYLVAHK